MACGYGAAIIARAVNSMRNALVLGKFMPPTLGHQFLIDFACAYDAQMTVTVVVATQAHEPISGQARYQALAQHYQPQPQVRVCWVERTMPQTPDQAPDFWAQWQALLHECGQFSHVFASETYGQPLAQVLGAQFVPVDLARHSVPISASVVRQDYRRYFAYLLPEIRPLLTKRVVLTGVESVGKTTLAALLAQTLDCAWLPEYARGFLDAVGLEVDEAKLQAIVAGQLASEAAQLRSGRHGLIVQDTDLTSTLLWGEILLRPCPSWVSNLLQHQRFQAADVYLLLDDNIPFVTDAQRYGGHQRQACTADVRRLLERHRLPYVLIDGVTLEQRLAQCVAAISDMA